MCGRVVQVSDPIRLSIVDGLDVRDSRLSNYPRRWNGAPSQELLVIRENHKTGERSLDLLTWGLIPYWCTDPKGGRGAIHDRMPAVLAPAAYDRWLGTEPDPRDLLQPFPSELMAIWPISARVNSPSNDDEQLLEEIKLAKAPAAVIAPESSAAHPLSDQRTRKTATRQ